MVKGHGQDTVCCIHAHEIFVLKMGSTNNVLYLLYIAFIENYLRNRSAPAVNC